MVAYKTLFWGTKRQGVGGEEEVSVRDTALLGL